MEQERQDEQTESQEDEIKDLDVDDEKMDEIKGGSGGDRPTE